VAAVLENVTSWVITLPFGERTMPSADCSRILATDMDFMPVEQ
jgi:hypothetical protein